MTNAYSKCLVYTKIRAHCYCTFVRVHDGSARNRRGKNFINLINLIVFFFFLVSFFALIFEVAEEGAGISRFDDFSYQFLFLARRRDDPNKARNQLVFDTRL